MEVSRNNLSAHRVELSVTLSAEEMRRYAERAAERLSEQTSIQGFRAGKAPFEVVKNRVGEMAIMEEASRIAVAKTLDEALEKNITEEWAGRPDISITKLAPDNEFSYTVTLTLVPEVTLGEYKGLGVNVEPEPASDKEVETVINRLRETRVKEAAVDRPAKAGDKIILDINVSLDNVPLEGGQGKDTAVIIGNENLVPGFDEHLIGLRKGEERDFKVHYPADYGQKMLADKKVDFHVVTKEVFERELPELNDEFVQAFGLKSVDELRSNLRKNIEDEKKHEAAHKLERELLENIVAKATIAELPEELIKTEMDNMFKELEHNVVSQGGRFDQYLASIGKTATALREELRPQALERLKTSLVLRSVIKAENIEVAADEIKAEHEALKERYKSDPKAVETIDSPAYRRHTEAMLLNRKAIERLLELN